MGSNYLLKEGIKNVFKNKKSTTISLITMIIAMFLFGAFFAIGANVNYILEQVQKEQGIEVFLVKDATEEQIDELEQKIKALDGINTVTFKSKQEALETMKENLQDNQDLLEGFESDNFSASFIVTLSDLSLATEIETKIENMDNVKKIRSKNETMITLMNIANWIRVATGVISVIMILFSVTIIANTIRLTVDARRKEISIMKYVGATNRFIRLPFVIEGVIIGVVAAGITICIVGGLYNMIVQSISEDVSKTAGIMLLSFSEIINAIVIVYVAIGIGVGVLGSSISMKRYLEV